METYTQGAIRPESIVGKPLVVYIDGERQEIGVITNAAVRGDRLYVGARINIGEADVEGLAEIMEEPS